MMTPKTIRRLSALLAMHILTAPVALSQQTGVSKEQITLGSIQDTSGPLAASGRAARNGMLMRVGEINEAGGIQGRTLKLVIEDSAYDPQRARSAAEKLVLQDKIFAMVGTLGSEVAEASLPLLLEKKVLHLFPLSAARQMVEPLHRLKFGVGPAYEDQIRAGVKWLAAERKAQKFCVLYQDDGFGEEVLKGAELGLKDIQLSLLAKADFKPGTTDFTLHAEKLQNAGCESIVLGSTIGETIKAVTSLRKSGWDPLILGSAAAYSNTIHKLGGRTMEGLYATYFIGAPYTDDVQKPVRDWAWRYKTKFNEDPSVFAAYGYQMVDLFAQAATRTGSTLTTDGLVKTLETMSFSRDIFGSPDYKFSPTNHLGTRHVSIGQIKNGRWKPVAAALNL